MAINSEFSLQTGTMEMLADRLRHIASGQASSTSSLDALPKRADSAIGTP